MSPLPHRIVVLALAVLAGCASGPEPSFGRIRLRPSEAQQDFDTDMLVSWDATVAALNELGYRLGDQAAFHRASPTITVDDVALRLIPHDDWTRIAVRVGDMESDAERDRAITILDEIGGRLEARYRGDNGGSGS